MKTRGGRTKDGAGFGASVLRCPLQGGGGLSNSHPILGMRIGMDIPSEMSVEHARGDIKQAGRYRSLYSDWGLGLGIEI